MALIDMIKSAERWKGELSIQEVQMYKEEPGLCLIKRTCLDERMPSDHIRQISRLDFQEGRIEYLVNEEGKKKTRTLNRNFFEDYLVFNPIMQDYQFGFENVRNSSINKEQIKERSDRLWKLYFSHLIDDFESRKKAKVKTRFSPRLSRGLVLGIFAAMALTVNTIYNRGYNPDRFEQEELFPEIHAQYRGIKRENFERLLREAKKVITENHGLENKYKRGPDGFNIDDTIFVLAPSDTHYDYSRNTVDFNKVKYFTRSSSSRYDYDELFPAVVKYIAENDLKGDKWSEDHYHFKIPSSVIKDKWSYTQKKDPYRVVLSPAVMKVLEEYKQTKQKYIAFLSKMNEIREELTLFSKVEPHYKIDLEKLAQEIGLE